MLPRGIEHTFVVTSHIARVLTLYTPAGFEGYVRELGGMPLASAAAPNLAAEVEHMIAVAARYGCDMTMPVLRDDGSA